MKDTDCSSANKRGYILIISIINIYDSDDWKIVSKLRAVSHAFDLCGHCELKLKSLYENDRFPASSSAKR